jgi:hypothetical protein
VGAPILEIDSAHGHDGFLIDAAKFELELLALKPQSIDAPSEEDFQPPRIGEAQRSASDSQARA